MFSSSHGLLWLASFSFLPNFNPKFGLIRNLNKVFLDEHSYAMLTPPLLDSIYTGAGKGVHFGHIFKKIYSTTSANLTASANNLIANLIAANN